MITKPLVQFHRRAIAGLAVFAFLIAGVSDGSAQMRQQCLKEVKQICAGIKRSELRQCLTKNFSDFSKKCQQKLRDRANQNSAATNKNEKTLNNLTRISETLEFGRYPAQNIDFFLNQAEQNAPIILYIHGGAWQTGRRSNVQSKPAWFNGLGYAFGSVGYRLHPQVEVEQQAADIALAIKAIRQNADQFNFDSNRIILMGHSAGAHLAALLATDPKYLGDSFSAIIGVILLDSGAYDIPAAMRDAPSQTRRRKLFETVFSNDPKRQATLSPITYTDQANVPQWLILYVANRTASQRQSEALGSALKLAGSKASVRSIESTNHSGLNKDLGTGKLAADAMITTFLRDVAR